MYFLQSLYNFNIYTVRRKTHTAEYNILFVMNILKKIIYFFLKIQEKQLSIRLDKHLKISSANKTSKTILSSNVTVTFNSETEKNKELVLNTVSKIVSEVKNNPYMLLEYIKTHNTKVIKLANADKILAFIGEDEGLVCEMKGLEALYINILTDNGISFKSKPMFILREGEIEPYYMLHQFYKWYAMYRGLPGFDYKSQKLFRRYLNAPDTKGLENLTLDEMTGLKEAIDRDNEAIDFTVNYAKLIDGSKNVLDKIKTEGGANV